MDDSLGRVRPRGRFPVANVALFLATIATTLWAGFLMSPLAAGGFSFGNVVAGGFPFAGSLIAILLTHEMGHYGLARRWQVRTTLPYFIPLPIGFGTLGAVIRMRSALPSRRAALDIGAAGPLAGFAMALPLLFWSIAHAEVRAVEVHASSAGQSAIAVLHGLLRHREYADSSFQLFGDSALTLAAARIVHGPLPPGHDLLVSPMFIAVWLGLLITALNLMPMGQLDGGHVLYALLGRKRARTASRIASVGLLLAGLFISWNWLLWWLVTRFVGVGHPPALVEEPLDARRKAIAILSLVLFAVTFIPIPLPLTVSS